MNWNSSGPINLTPKEFAFANTFVCVCLLKNWLRFYFLCRGWRMESERKESWLWSVTWEAFKFVCVLWKPEELCDKCVWTLFWNGGLLWQRPHKCLKQNFETHYLIITWNSNRLHEKKRVYNSWEKSKNAPGFTFLHISLEATSYYTSSTRVKGTYGLGFLNCNKVLTDSLLHFIQWKSYRIVANIFPNYLAQKSFVF